MDSEIFDRYCNIYELTGTCNVAGKCWCVDYICYRMHDKAGYIEEAYLKYLMMSSQGLKYSGVFHDIFKRF